MLYLAFIADHLSIIDSFFVKTTKSGGGKFYEIDFAEWYSSYYIYAADDADYYIIVLWDDKWYL